MKHLKIYESFEEILPKTGSYVIYNGDEYYIILKIFDHSHRQTKIQKILKTQKDKINIVEYDRLLSKNNYYTPTDNLNNNIVFTSDNVKDCINNLSIFINSNKYNL